ncbi:peroxisome biogenesis factor 2 [Hylaeus volcanicus]|uniref:peroxisome biogenesis factor 2 n=1 Tax=Hylaeus volcanicus TaxID=313075 RepID=UPI0023B81862|nr:peroxisome biogenesis factor 2 [Hylaeus volcanicus]
MQASPYVSRVNQIDAVQLDEEIYKVLRDQAKKITEYQLVDRADRWQPEIDAIVKFFVWYFSLRHGKSTFGQQLLNLHYEHINRTKSILYLVLTVGPTYVRDKLVGGVANQRLNELFDRIANLSKLLEFINLLIFLHRGTQPRIIEYLLGIASRSTTTHKPRNIGYSYMTRELLWHGLMELFTTGLPMINFHYLKHAIKKLLSRGNRDRLLRSFPSMDGSTKCSYCNDNPIMPAHAGCEHVYCYYCLKAHFTATNQIQCYDCGAELCVEDMKMFETSPASLNPDETI